jgi:hypothetical protein
MDLRAVSEHVTALRTEIATLHRLNRLYMRRVSHTPYERQRNKFRSERLERIMRELTDLAGHRDPLADSPMARKHQDWAA